ncbi:MAG: methyl-accepting chemotaxis protein [Desulfobacteraceae bacterium]|nr:methyl-accepting chemotaxis protein [Desulfobacteraceae bacterium]
MFRRSIVAKIVACACGIISVLLIPGSYALIKYETDLVQTNRDEYLKIINQSIDDREHEQKADLEENIHSNAKILGGMSVIFLDNFNPEGLKQSLRAYMNYPEILAVKVTDEDGEPFAATWKTPEIAAGNELPGSISLDKRFSVKVDAMLEGKKQGTIQVFYTDAVLLEKIKNARQKASEKAGNFYNISRSRLDKVIVRQITGIVIILLALLVCLIVFLKTMILKPVLAISGTARKLADYDLTVNTDTNREDEIGHLLASVNNMVLEFRKIACDVKSGGKRLETSSVQMTEVISNIASTAEQMSASVHSVSETTGYMSENVNAVAGAIEEMSCSINEAGKNARHGAVTAGDAVKLAEKAGDTMTSLGKAADEIGEVTEVIKRIADKTTILGFNADIEAASAGEAGKGFAVVADEIKEFARQSTRAADDIANRISVMQENSEDAVASIGNVSGIINSINSSSEIISLALNEQMKAVNEIASNAAEANTRARNIAFSMGELAQGASEVSMSVGMAAGGKSVDTDGHHIDASAAEVAKLAKELLELVDKFKVD